MVNLEIAEKFVQLVFDYEHQTALPKESYDTLFALIAAAQFRGSVESNNEGKDCPFRVMIDERGALAETASLWLEKAWKRVIRGKLNEPRETIVKDIFDGIQNTIPLTPIQLAGEGSTMMGVSWIDPNQDFPFFIVNIGDSDAIGSYAGRHLYCGGWFRRILISEASFVIACDRCHFREVFERSIQTYGELREEVNNRSNNPGLRRLRRPIRAHGDLRKAGIPCWPKARRA